MGLAVREVEDPEEGDEKLYVRVGMFHFFCEVTKLETRIHLCVSSQLSDVIVSRAGKERR